MKSFSKLMAASVLLVLVLSAFPMAGAGTAHAAACDLSQFVVDVTVPDGTVFAPGASFTKTWRLKNIGTCTWTTSYALAFYSGDQMYAPASVTFTGSVAPGQTVDLSVSMTAPYTAGHYRGYWKLKNASSILFGDAFYVDIYVDPSAGLNPIVTSIVQAGSNPTSAASVGFKVTFTEAVTGVDSTDFSLTTTGVSGAAVSGVSGSGATRTVSVNTGSGSGTIRLNLIDNDTIINASGNKLGGTGIGNGNFTAGETYTIQRQSGDTTGVFRPSNGLLYLKNANTTGFADIAINYGTGGDYPVTGDWDGNGTDTIGIYRNGSFYLRNSNTLGFANMVFAFGTPGDQPIAGDWDGNGTDTIGVYRPSTGQFLLRNSNSAGSPQMSFYLGNVGDVGIAGDWDGDGDDTTGVFRPSNGVIFLKNTNSTGFADIALNYGIPGDQPVTGDWNNDGVDTIGVYRNGQFMLRNSNTIGFADIVLGLGIPGDMPIAGNWDGMP